MLNETVRTVITWKVPVMNTALCQKHELKLPIIICSFLITVTDSSTTPQPVTHIQCLEYEVTCPAYCTVDVMYAT